MKRVRALAIAMSLPFVVAAMSLATDWLAVESAAASEAATSAEKGILSVGSISRLPKKEVATFQPFADHLARQLRTVGISGGRVVVAGSMAEMAGLMRKGEVDIYIDSPFPIAVVGMRSGARPFLRRWKRNQVEYHSLIFGRKDGGLETARDLRGKMVAFDEPFSTAGYLLPKATLMKAGMRLTEYADASARVPPNAVGYVFANDEENIMVWVLRGKVPAGSLSEQRFERLAKNRRGELKVLLRTMDVPRQVVSHRADLSANLVARIQEVLLGMAYSEEGKRVLQDFENTTRFDRFPQGAAEAFRPIEALARLVEKDMGK